MKTKIFVAIVLLLGVFFIANYSYSTFTDGDPKCKCENCKCETCKCDENCACCKDGQGSGDCSKCTHKEKCEMKGDMSKCADKEKCEKKGDMSKCTRMQGQGENREGCCMKKSECKMKKTEGTQQ